jgi:hypothetical protein
MFLLKTTVAAPSLVAVCHARKQASAAVTQCGSVSLPLAVVTAPWRARGVAHINTRRQQNRWSCQPQVAAGVCICRAC